MRRMLVVMALLGGLMAAPVSACPLCKLANESKQQNEEANLRPKAYMYSILFMLSMPATLVGAFGVTFWRISRRGNPADLLEETDPNDDDAI